ncbi:hypothetical protein VMCG_06105 [Cytospora schulzeri]|uniref:Uncharacterized protein n=1 Tax=Cytospora schulzeri TaxID=448051 RepID=A0A423WGG0_9PEZI|nr:hypothetical protein VMCG_06105 [Valsa malicola]
MRYPGISSGQAHVLGYWAWFIVGAFYDKDDHKLWQTEIFLGQFSWLNRNGWSSQHGYDLGPPPPRVGVTAYYPQQQYYYGAYGRPYAAPGHAPYMASNVQHTQFAPMSHDQGRSGNPVIDSSMPAANLTNSTGGVGCEPGYNYFFPSEHTKIHVLQTGGTAPWSLPPHFTAPFKAVHAPVNMTIGDLLKGFGAVNPDAKKNRVFELHQGGNGVWYKGLAFKGDDDKDMAKEIKSVGWDKSRNGLPGGKPVVYLYVTKG